MTRHALLPLLAVIALTLSSCQSNAGPDASGSISGSVTLTGIDRLELDDNSGVTVEIEGKGKATTTASDGSFTFGDLPAGIYTFLFRKEGFYSLKVEGFQFIGGGGAFLPPAFLPERLSGKVSLSTSMNGDTVVLHTSVPRSNARSVEISYAVRTNDDFTTAGQSTGRVFDAYFHLPAGSTGYDQKINPGHFRFPSTPPGTKLYVKVWPQLGRCGVLEGASSGSTVRASVIGDLSEFDSEVLSFIVP